MVPTVLYYYVLYFSIIISVHCNLLQFLSTNKCNYCTNIYFTLSGSHMFRLVAILRELTTKYQAPVHF